MTARHMRPAPTRAPVAPLHRGPGAITHGAPVQHAPNAALLIDFDNVTMGIRSDLQAELRHLLSSDIIKGKVAVQRAYADWRRYPQYIVPLAESSIDMIMAPAYGSSKKNATDIRLAVDAMELVFTRPEIGTYILLSGDSDFASLVTKLKEYGKYVIGVGIRESSSDLLVMNCDEYYSYNALAGLMRAGEEEAVAHDPWELVSEAIDRMAKNGDVMRSDRLKQVMQDMDPSFDEKDLGYAKFSRFCLDAAQRGLLAVNRLENGQLEVAPPGARAAAPAAAVAAPAAPAAREEHEEEAEERGRRGRGRGRRRGRGPREEREERAPRAEREERPAAEAAPVEREAPREVAAEPEVAPPPRPDVVVGRTGERLTRSEAFDLVRRATEELVQGDRTASARDVRLKAYDILGRDSESLSERNFPRILKDASDAGVIELRRSGDDFEVARAASEAPMTEQLNRAAAAQAAPPAEAPAPPTPRGMGPRGVTGRGMGRGRGPAAPPPDLLMVGVVETPPAAGTPASEAPSASAPAGEPATAAPEAATPEATAPEAPARGARKGGRAAKSGRTARKAAAKTVAKNAAAKQPAKNASAAKNAGPAKTAAPARNATPAKGAAPAKRAAAKRGARKAAAAEPAPAPAVEAAAPAKSGRGRRGRGARKTPAAGEGA